MSDGRIRTHLAADGGLEIVIDRPEAGNALTAAMTDDLARAVSDLPAEAKFVVLSGAGDDFCAGRVSPMPKDAGERITAGVLRDRVAGPVLDFYERVRSLPLPLITVVRGRAHGVGCALAGLGDLVLADETAEFMIPEMNRDIPPTLVMTALADRLPRAAHARLVYLREPVGAAEAVAIGLAGEACASAEVEARLAVYRTRLADASRGTLATVKRFLNAAPEMGFSALKDYAAVANSAAVSERFVPAPQPSESK